ncbi:unnamed protein product [Orchesella dallaii]|uniref:Uncharacterized protein n=1 Tax=Orchesella dallaii TaxID=48710 RepID=A0ABP1QCV7_9HEXA
MSDFDKAIQATKVLELQVAQLHVDVQTHDPKKVTLQNINDDRAILKSFENCVWEQNVTLANAAKDDDEVKTAASRLNIIRKYIRVCLQILSTLEASLPPKPAATPAPTIATCNAKHNSLLHLPKVAPEDQANKVETHGEIKEAPASPIVKPDSSGIPASAPSRVAEDSFYVDDLMGGAQGTHDGQLVQQQLSNMMSLGCLDIRIHVLISSSASQHMP